MKRVIVLFIAALALSLCIVPASVFANDAAPVNLFAQNETSAPEYVPISTSEGNYTVEVQPLEIAPIPDQTYTGKAIEPTLTVTMGYVTISDYEVTYANNVDVGTATVTVTTPYSSGTTTFNIVAAPSSATSEQAQPAAKAANSITKVTAKKTFKAKKLKKKKQSFKIKATAQDGAALSFKKVSVTKKKAARYFKVSKAGKVTVRKGLKQGTYKLKVAITASETARYLPCTVTKTIKVKVK